MTSKPLRVLQILPRLDVGGVERGTLEWAHALQQMGHLPLVVSGGGPGADWLQQHGIQHIELPVGKKRLSSIRLIAQLRCLFSHHEVDLVHARSRLPAWLSHWAIKNMPNTPAFVTTLHGLHTVSPYAAIMAKGDAVIAVSETAAAYLTDHFAKHLKSQPVVIYRGIDEAEFPYQAKAKPEWLQNFTSQFPDSNRWFKVLLPGRMTAIKGGLGLLDWLSACSNATVLIVNGKPQDSGYTRTFHQSAIKKGVADRVIWLGVERDMTSLYAFADVVLSVNKKPESFGRTVLEALTVGRPVVAYDHGGVSEIMRALFPQGLVPVNDLAALTDKLKSFQESPPVVPRHDQFKLSQQFEQTMALYQKVLASKSQVSAS